MATNFWKGQASQFFLDILTLKGGVDVMHVTADPTVVSVDAKTGSVAIFDTDIYVKQDDGNTTNWEKQQGPPYIEDVRDPLISDDSYEKGTLWTNTVDMNTFLCQDNPAGNAVWILLTDGGVPILTKGGIITSDGITNGELTVGSDGQILFADSGAAEGMAWKDIPIGYGVARNLNTGIDYPTIQQAIDAAANNESIGVASGNHISMDLNFIGTNLTAVTVVGVGSALDNNTQVGRLLLDTTCTDISFKNLDFYNSSNSAYEDNGSSNTSFSDCKFDTLAANVVRVTTAGTGQLPAFNNCRFLGGVVANQANDTAKFLTFNYCPDIQTFRNQGSSGAILRFCNINASLEHSSGVVFADQCRLPYIQSGANIAPTNILFINKCNGVDASSGNIQIDKTGTCFYKIYATSFNVVTSQLFGSDLSDIYDSSFGYRVFGKTLTDLATYNNHEGLLTYATDENRFYGSDGSVMKGIAYVTDIAGSSAVTSVNTKIGDVVLDADDIDDTTTAHKFASQAELDQIATNQTDIADINASVGQPNGIAPLDSSGLVPAVNLPAYVDDIIEVADYASLLLLTGETGKIYITLDDNKQYRWSGSTWVELNPAQSSVEIYADRATFPATGQADIIYIAEDTNQIYRYSGAPNYDELGNVLFLATEGDLSGEEDLGILYVTEDTNLLYRWDGSAHVLVGGQSSGGSGGTEAYADISLFPTVGKKDIVYIAEDTEKIYRWDGAGYSELSADESTPLMGKGSVFTSDGVSNGELTVGINGQILRADSNEVSGLKFDHATITGTKSELMLSAVEGQVYYATDEDKLYKYDGAKLVEILDEDSDNAKLVPDLTDETQYLSGTGEFKDLYRGMLAQSVTTLTGINTFTFNVDASGNITEQNIGGSGITVNKESTGTYKVNYSSLGLTSPPTVQTVAVNVNNNVRSYTSRLSSEPTATEAVILTHLSNSSSPASGVIDLPFTITIEKNAPDYISVVNPSLTYSTYMGDGHTGEIIAMAATSAPINFLRCNGAEVEKASYPELYSIIGDAWGVATDINNFVLPNLDGQFLRGASQDNTVDPDGPRNVGSYQAGALEAHFHTTVGQSQGNNNGFSTTAYKRSGGGSSATIKSSTVGGDETRPTNAAVGYYIRAFSRGLVDIVKPTNVIYSQIATGASRSIDASTGTGTSAFTTTLLTLASQLTGNVGIREIDLGGKSENTLDVNYEIFNYIESAGGQAVESYISDGTTDILVSSDSNTGIISVAGVDISSLSGPIKLVIKTTDGFDGTADLNAIQIQIPKPILVVNAGYNVYDMVTDTYKPVFRFQADPHTFNGGDILVSGVDEIINVKGGINTGGNKISFPWWFPGQETFVFVGGGNLSFQKAVGTVAGGSMVIEFTYL